jgi:hypothetical protein
LKSAEPDIEESSLFIKALRDMIMPRFTKDDLLLFESILMDLFPGVE